MFKKLENFNKFKHYDALQIFLENAVVEEHCSLQQIKLCDDGESS